MTNIVLCSSELRQFQGHLITDKEARSILEALGNSPSPNVSPIAILEQGSMTIDWAVQLNGGLTHHNHFDYISPHRTADMAGVSLVGSLSPTQTKSTPSATTSEMFG